MNKAYNDQLQAPSHSIQFGQATAISVSCSDSDSASTASSISRFYSISSANAESTSTGISPFTALVDTTVNKGCHLLCELIIFIFHGFGITCHKYWKKAVDAATQSSTEASKCIIYCIICGFYQNISNYYGHYMYITI